MSVIFTYFVFLLLFYAMFEFNFHSKSIFDIRVHIIIPLKILKVSAVRTVY